MQCLDYLVDPAPLPDEMACRNDENEFEPPARDDVLALKGIPLDALAILLRLVLPAGRNPETASFWRTSTLRLACLALFVDKDVRSLSQSDIAKATGYTRSAINVQVVALRDAFGLDHRAGCCSEAREVFRAAQIDSWEKRQNAKAASKTLVDSSAKTCKQTSPRSSSRKAEAR